MSAGGWVIFWAVVAVVVIAEFVRESKSKNSDIWDAGVERRRRG
jgi:ABC-type Co2+ transport system permease subunit